MAIITVTAQPIDQQGPRVKVDVDDVPSGFRVTVYRVADGMSAVVRGARNAFASGGFSVVDYEAPGGTIAYRAELFDESGIPQGFTDTASTELSWPSHIAYFSDPLDPGNVYAAEMHTNFGSVVSRPRASAQYDIGDRRVSLLGILGKIRGIPLWCNTYTQADSERFLAVLRVSNVLVRTMPPVRVPRSLYTAVENPEEHDITVQLGYGQVRWELTGDEVSAPELSVVVPVVTWQTYIDAFPTWADFNAAYLTWNDAIRNPPEV